MTQPEWDDDRLDAAFHARFDRPAPMDLAKDVHVRIAGTSPARFGRPQVRRAWSLAAAAVIVVLVAGTAMVGLGGLGETGSSPVPSDASASAPAPNATPTEQALPGIALERLPIIGVTDAIAVRDAGIDDREIAVHGWFTNVRPRNCGIVPPERPVSPVQLRCPDDRMWLTEDHEDTDAPTGPALNAMVSGLDMTTVEQAPNPVDVVFVGHFDDRRAEMCPKAEIDACRDRFVVDAVAHLHGTVQPPSRLRMADGMSTEAEVEAIVANEAPDSPILATTLVDSDGLMFLEPSLGTGQQGLIDQRRLWIVRVLEAQRVVTYVVIDGSDAIYEMNTEGQAILVGGEPPPSQAPASPAIWPPSGAPVVVLTSEVGAGEPPARVAVVDESGRLSSVSETGDVDPATISFDGRFGAYAEPGHPGRVHLTWVGGICDSQITVTVAEDIKTITFDMGAPVDCDSIGIGRQLVLDFTGLVDVPAIQLGDGIATPPAGPSYDLDCGPLGPDTCETKADAIVAATRNASPTKRVVSITFGGTEDCLSQTVFFDDGTGSAAQPGCIASPEPS